MELKKNPNVDPKRNSKLFFQVGLVAVLFLTYLGIEYKSMDPAPKEEEQGLITQNNVVDEEEVIITLPPVQKLPPPPPPAPEVIEVVKDEIKIEKEEKIQETETNENVEVKKITATQVGGDPNAVVEDPIPDELPFTLIEQVPLFPGCEKKPKAEQSKCFQDELNKFVSRNFKTPDDLEPGYKARVYVTFIIDPKGNIIEVTPTGGTPSLQKAALKAFDKAPKLQPGKQRNTPVRCKFTYPISIKITD
ncbi:energy transducer TonB [Flavobacterium sp.]|uniref:energy transducer TonB n=1 Tax=Flavobacterium sp. TaxID=239 RepID=UPI00352986CC